MSSSSCLKDAGIKPLSVVSYSCRTWVICNRTKRNLYMNGYSWMLVSNFFASFAQIGVQVNAELWYQGKGKEREERLAKTCKEQEVKKRKKGKENIRIKNIWRGGKKSLKGKSKVFVGTWSEEAIIIPKSSSTEHLYRHTFCQLMVRSFLFVFGGI